MSADDPKELKPPAYAKEPDTVRAQVLSGILQEYDVLNNQKAMRQQLLKELEGYTPGKSSAYIGFLCSERENASIDSDDISAFGDVLLSVGEVDELNLIINSPGGDGTIAEKIIELCRAYCKTFRVIVPNRAKSAATIIALGADEIVMGYCSELGPIDAQIVVTMSGVPHYISAQSFIDARDNLAKRFEEAKTKKLDVRPVLQQIASLDSAFIDHCEKLMDFSREVAKKYLSKYMFSKMAPAAAQRKAIQNVLEKLSAVHIFKVHGRMIDGNYARTNLKLNVRLLAKDDPMWDLIWNYYVRADVLMSRNGVSKLLESKYEMLMRQRQS